MPDERPTDEELPEEFAAFEALTRDLLKVSKKELDERVAAAKAERSA